MATHRCAATHRRVIARSARARAHAQSEIEQGKQRIAYALFGEFVQLKSKRGGGAKLRLIIIISAGVIGKYLLSCLELVGTVSTTLREGVSASLRRDIPAVSCCKEDRKLQGDPRLLPPVISDQLHQPSRIHPRHGDLCSLLRSHGLINTKK